MLAFLRKLIARLSGQADDTFEQVDRQIAEGATAVPPFQCAPGCTCRGFDHGERN